MSNNCSTNQNQETKGVPQHLIHIFEETIQQKIKLLTKTAGKKSCSIFRAPPTLVKIHPEVFQPQIVSIGPYHHEKQNLQMIQEHKKRILCSVLARTKKFNVDICNFYEAIKSKEDEIMECYSESIECNDLIEMMVVDGCFIMEYVCVVGRLVEPEPYDPLITNPWITYALSKDFLKLENQIPFFILETLFHLSFPDKTRSDLAKLILEFFRCSMKIPVVDGEALTNNDWGHLLDLVSSAFIPSSETPTTFNPSSETPTTDTSNDYLALIQPVEKLRTAGIEFEPREDKRISFLDVKFRPDGVLEIPPLKTEDFMRSFIFNCVAFEQCYSHCSTYFTSYLIFMGCLINTTYDAAYLRDHRIIQNYFGTDEEVIKLFNDVNRDVFFNIERSYLAKLFEDVNRYWRSYWHVQRAGFTQTYLSSTWVFISAIAALILLILTVIKTFYDIAGYHKPTQ